MVVAVLVGVKTRARARTKTRRVGPSIDPSRLPHQPGGAIIVVIIPETRVRTRARSRSELGQAPGQGLASGLGQVRTRASQQYEV